MKLYSFSRKSLRFEEVRWTRTRFVAWGLLAGVAVSFGLLELNHMLNGSLGLGFSRTDALIAENAVLREQIVSISSRIESLEGNLKRVNERGNHLRLLMDMQEIDEDTRQAGTGGVALDVDFTASVDVSAELNRLRKNLFSAEQELQLQSTSYREVADRYETNKSRFSSLPAIRPMDGYYSKRGIGVRLHPVLNIYRRHEGLDIAADPGTPVYASGDGVVEFSGRSGGFGIMVEVNHGYSYRTIYGHLSKALVKEGQRVKRGTLIALSGNTGLSSGPHLHYEIRKNGVPQDPLGYFFDDVDFIAEAGAPLMNEDLEKLFIEDPQ
jgi:murein DD-endopeptidase MepM/ murein hydrolase activator NlpD